MKRPGNDIAKLDRQIAELEQAVEDRELERERHEAAAAEAEARKPLAAADAATFAALNDEIRAHQSEIERLGIVVERLKVDFEQAWEEREHALYAAALDELAGARSKTARMSAAFIEKALELAALAGKLKADRRAEDEAVARARERCPGEVAFELVGPDEPAWDVDAAPVTALLSAGPRQPAAKAERERRKVEAEWARREDPEQIIRDAVCSVLFRNASLSVIDGRFVEEGRPLGEEGEPRRRVGGIPEGLRSEAHRRLAAARAEYERLCAERDREPPHRRRTISGSELDPWIEGKRRAPAPEAVEA